MTGDFTDDELKVFGCFINPKYPQAIRSAKAVVTETSLSEEDVMAIFARYDGLLFRPTDGKWAFNFALFARKYMARYPDLFSEYVVYITPVGSVVASKNASKEEVADMINKIVNTAIAGPEEELQVTKSILSAMSDFIQDGPVVATPDNREIDPNRLVGNASDNIDGSTSFSA